MSAQSEILVNIRAVDKATAEMRRVQQATVGLQDSIRSLGFGSVLAYTSAGLALGEFARRGIAEIAEADRVNAQLNATLKSTGAVAGVTSRYLDDLAGTLGDMAAVDDEIVKGGEAVLLTFTNIRNVGADKIFDDAMTAALDLSRAFNQDLQSSVIQIGKALQDPIAGVTALRRVGVQLSADQEEQIRKFVEMNDVMSAQKVILGELQKEVGGSAKAYGETFSGQVARAKDRLDEFSGVIVGNTIVGLSMMFGWVTDVTGALGDLIDRVDVFGVLAGSTDDAARAAQAEAETWAWLHREMDTTATKAHSVQAELVTINGQLAQFGPMPPTVFGPTIEQAELLKQKADEARRAIFDAINLPSAERQQREAGLAQAEFNVGILEQKRAKGPLSPDNEAWYQWLVNTFIPAQQQWLKLDELRVNRDEKNAALAERLTGDYRDMNQVQQGTIAGLTNITDGTYDVNDAMQGLAALPPANLKVNLDGPKTDPSKIKPELKAYINDVNDWLKQFPFNWGFDDPPFPPRQMTKNEARAFIKDVNDFLKNLPFHWHIPDPKFPDEEPTKEDTREFVKNVNDFFKNLPFHWHIPDPDQPTAADITPDLRTTITNVNAFFDKTPFNWHIPTPWAPSDESLKGQASYIISRIRYWWSVLTNPFGGGAGLTFTPTDLQAAQALYGQIAATITRPHNEQGVAMPSFFTASGGSNVMVGPVILNGIDIASPTGAARFVDAIWPALRERMRQG